MPYLKSTFAITGSAMFCATTAISCPANMDIVFACDLVAMTQQVMLCERADQTGNRIEMEYSFGNPDDEPELQFSTENVWGNWNFEGYVEMIDLSGWNVGAVHPNGTVYSVYAYGSYRENFIRRAVLQVYPSLDDFNNARGAVFHAECKPNTIRSDDFAEYFRP